MALLHKSHKVQLCLALAALLHSVLVCECAPKNFLFEGDTGEVTTVASVVTEPVTSLDYVLIDNELGPGEEDIIAQPSETSENIIASESQTTSSKSGNELGTGNGGNKGTSGTSTQMNLILLQQLQEQLRRQQQIQQLALQSQQQQVTQQVQPQQQQQFSLEALVKSVLKMIHVAKTKIDAGAKTFRDILQLFDRKKYIVPQGSENNMIVT